MYDGDLNKLTKKFEQHACLGVGKFRNFAVLGGVSVAAKGLVNDQIRFRTRCKYCSNICSMILLKNLRLKMICLLGVDTMDLEIEKTLFLSSRWSH